MSSCRLLKVSNMMNQDMPGVDGELLALAGFAILYLWP
jgi:hypothetical protein